MSLTQCPDCHLSFSRFLRLDEGFHFPSGTIVARNGLHGPVAIVVVDVVVGLKLGTRESHALLLLLLLLLLLSYQTIVIISSTPIMNSDIMIISTANMIVIVSFMKIMPLILIP